MKKLTIQINGTDVTLKFNYALLRLLGELWNCAGPMAVMEKFTDAAGALISAIGNVDELEGKQDAGASFELPFNIISVFSDIICMAAKAENAFLELDADDCAEYIFNNAPKMGEIVELFVASMPVPEKQDQGKPQPETAQ